MRHSARGVVLLIAGAAILGSAVLQGVVNVPHLREDLLEIGVRRTLLAAVTLVLYFSVVAMFAFAGLVLSAAVESLRGGHPRRGPLWVVGASYLLFGAVAYTLVSRNVHFLGYAAMGLLVVLAAALSPALGRPGSGRPGSPPQ